MQSLRWHGLCFLWGSSRRILQATAKGKGCGEAGTESVEKDLENLERVEKERESKREFGERVDKDKERESKRGGGERADKDKERESK